MDLFKRIMEGKDSSRGGDKKQFVVDLLGADPIEVLEKKTGEVGRITGGSALEVAAAIYAMEIAIKVIKKSNFPEVEHLLDMFKKCVPEPGAVCVNINKATGETNVKNFNFNKE